MAREIERKFLVNSSDYKRQAKMNARIVQGYLNSSPERTVRVRIKGERGYITVKGRAETGTIDRYEWEKEIPLTEAQELMKLCEDGIIDKIRYLVDYKGHVFEIDEFAGANHGLVVAEVELTEENEQIDFPDWVGREVTGQKHYYNSALAKNPFTKWE